MCHVTVDAQLLPLASSSPSPSLARPSDKFIVILAQQSLVIELLRHFDKTDDGSKPVKLSSEAGLLTAELLRLFVRGEGGKLLLTSFRTRALFISSFA